jgi:outer membrane protein TolC
MIMVNPVPIDIAQATEFALTATPRMRQLDIQYRRNELNLDQTKGRNAFRVNLNFSYGREALDSQFRNVFGNPTNTYSVDVTARIPIWDGGERRERIASSEISIQQTGLRIEEAETQIVSRIQNEVRNVAEFQDRALNMETNLLLANQLSESTLALYVQGSASMFDLLQTFRTEAQTAENLLDAYLGWRNSLLRIQEMTYFDFEVGVPVLERYGVRLPGQGT